MSRDRGVLWCVEQGRCPGQRQPHEQGGVVAEVCAGGCMVSVQNAIEAQVLSQRGSDYESIQSTPMPRIGVTHICGRPARLKLGKAHFNSWNGTVPVSSSNDEATVSVDR